MGGGVFGSGWEFPFLLLVLLILLLVLVSLGLGWGLGLHVMAGDRGVLTCGSRVWRWAVYGWPD